MHKKFILLLILFPLPVFAELTHDFVYLKDIDPSILQEMRYAGYHNFIGYPIKGYETGECILTRPTAVALSKVQADLKKLSLSLKVYDCYRPQMAVDHFIVWSKQTDQQQMKAEFYPRVNKADFFKLGYVAEKSGHTRGSTIDLTIVPSSTTQQSDYQPGQKLNSCFASVENRFPDNSINMGTGYDCMDELAHAKNKQISVTAYRNRQLLRSLMEKNGFNYYLYEWWHFTLKNEPYPNSYFNFKVKARAPLSLSQSRQLLLVLTNKCNAINVSLPNNHGLHCLQQIITRRIYLPTKRNAKFISKNRHY